MITNQRICFVNYYVENIYHPETKAIFGGAEVQLYQLMTALYQTSDWAVHVLSHNQRRPRVEQYRNIIFWHVRELRNRPLFNLYNVLQTFTAMIKLNADVYVTRAASFDTGLVALYCRLFHKKFVFMTAHSLDVDGSFERDNSWLARYMYRYGLQHATVILAQNHEHISALQQQHGVTARYLPNGFIIPPMPVHHQPHTILWVGRAHASKQPEVFVRLAQQFPAEQFVMILNPQEPAIEQAVQRLTAALPNLSVVKGVPFFVVDQYFSEAKVFINTSSAEGFPNTFIQAGIAGCPILSLTVNPDHFLDTFNTGWCAQGSELELQKQLRQLLAEPALLQTAGRNNRQYVEAHHNINNTITELLSHLSVITK